MKTKIILISEQHRQRVLEIVRALPLDVVHSVDIKEHKKDRSAAQNGLYFLWMGIVSGYTGESKEEVHCRMKKNHLIPIYCADPDNETAITMATIREAATLGAVGQAKKMEAYVIKKVSITEATVKQFAEYLNEIEKECISQGIYLPHPEDMWYEAMGKKP